MKSLRPPLWSMTCLVTAASSGVAQGPAFQPAVHFLVGSSPVDMDIGNFDGDPAGLPDLVIVDKGSVRLLINEGPGAPALLVEKYQPWIDSLMAHHRAVTSCNSDGNACADAVAANGGVIESYLNGCPGCTSSTLTPSLSSPTHLICVELYNDGIFHVVSSNAGTGDVAVFLNDGTGSFQAGQFFSAGGTPLDLTSGDFDQDGDEDLAVAVQSPSGVAILENLGGGAFAPPVVLSLPQDFEPEDVAAGDLNGDGDLDLVACGTDCPEDTVVVLLGTGGAGGITFGPPAEFTVAGLDPVAVVIEDLDLDGNADVATANGSSDSVSVLLGDGAGALGSPLVLAVGGGPVDLVSGDFNADGLPDLVSLNGGSSSVSVLLAARGLDFTGGDVGGAVSFELTGSPGEVYVLVPSFTTGPIPLSPFFPGNPDVMTVGMDLFNAGLSRVGTFADQQESEVYPLPLLPALDGMTLYAQFVSLNPPDFAGLSNRVDVPLFLPNTSTFTPSSVGTARQGHTVTRLANGDAVVIGGDEPDGGGGLIQALNTIELYDHASATFTTLGVTMNKRRSTHTATLLNDGRVLILGGYTNPADGTATAAGEIFDPVANTVTTIPPMQLPRLLHTATLLADGRVFVAGGVRKFILGDPFASIMQGIFETEIYDPVSNTWSSGPNFPDKHERFGHQASLLPNGQVLITGGMEERPIIPAFPTAVLIHYTDECHRYDPSTNTFVNTPPLPILSGMGIAYHAQATLSSGDVAVVGGVSSPDALVGSSLCVQRDSFLYDPASNSWTVGGQIQFPRVYGQLLETPDQRVFLIGGLRAIDLIAGTGTPEKRFEETDVTFQSWTHLPDMVMLKAREVSRAVLVGVGPFLCILSVGVGEIATPPAETTAEFYCP